MASGPHPKPMDTEFIIGPMAIGMKANGTCASNMVQELIHLQMEISTQANMLTVNPKEKVNMSGQLVKYTPETLSRARSMAKENGGAPELFNPAAPTKVTISSIRNMAKVSSPGQAVTSTKVITLKMSAMAMVRCFGQMAACMKENGAMASNMVSAE